MTIVCNPSGAVSHDKLLCAFVQYYTQIVEVYPPLYCTSMRVTLCSPLGKEIANRSDDIGDRQKGHANTSSDRCFHAAAFSGLPVAAEVIVRAKGLARSSDSIIRSVI